MSYNLRHGSPYYQRKPKRARLRKRKRVTLIAAFRCVTRRHVDGVLQPGVVICADSQETYGDYRVEVNKIKPRDAGNYDLIIGGAGNIGTLIDGLSNAIQRFISQWPAQMDEETARQRIESAIVSYYKKQVAFYPANVDEKNLRFLICVKGKQTSQIYLFKTDGTTVERVEDYALLGWEEAVYDYEVKWLYRDGITMAQAVLLGVHLLTIAKTSLYVGGDTQIIAAYEEGMAAQDVNEVRRLEQNIATFTATIARLTLACPDTSLEPEDFALLLVDFVRKAKQLHDDFCDDAMIVSVLRYIKDPSESSLLGDGYLKIPLNKTARLSTQAREEVRLARERGEIATPEHEAKLMIKTQAQRLGIPITDEDFVPKSKEPKKGKGDES